MLEAVFISADLPLGELRVLRPKLIEVINKLLQQIFHMKVSIFNPYFVLLSQLCFLLLLVGLTFTNDVLISDFVPFDDRK